MLRCENGGALHSLGMLACEAATDPELPVELFQTSHSPQQPTRRKLPFVTPRRCGRLGGWFEVRLASERRIASADSPLPDKVVPSGDLPKQARWNYLY